MPRLLLTTLLSLTVLGGGCINSEDVFVEGRLQDLCNGSIPVCNHQAACVLTPKRYLRSSFPGGQRIIVRTDLPDQQLILRIHYTELVYPGTEFIVQVFDPTCTGFDEEHLLDIDLFDYAGDDRIMQFELDLEGEGDHMVTMFSDMSAEYLLTVDVEG